MCVSQDHHAGPTRDTGFRSSKGGGPWGNKGQTRLSQGKALPQADGRKEVSTAQWEGVGKQCSDPHCFQLWGQLGQAQHKEFPCTGTAVRDGYHLAWQNPDPGAVSRRDSGG